MVVYLHTDTPKIGNTKSWVIGPLSSLTETHRDDILSDSAAFYRPSFNKQRERMIKTPRPTSPGFERQW